MYTLDVIWEKIQQRLQADDCGEVFGDLVSLSEALSISQEVSCRIGELKRAINSLEWLNNPGHPACALLSEPFCKTVRLMSDTIRYTGANRITYDQIELLIEIVRDNLSPKMSDDHHIDCENRILAAGLRIIPVVPGLAQMYEQEEGD